MTRIVLADDHPFLRTGVEAVLTGMGIDIAASVDDGDAALEAIEREDPDVVILDIRMPRRDGISTLEEMRRRGDERPVILLTAELEDSALLAALKAKVNGIVFKDGAESRLHEAVTAVAAGESFIDPQLLSKAFDLAIDDGRRKPLEALSARELAIAQAVAAGKRNREIAETVGMTEGSVKVYLHRIYEKLGIDNRTELAILLLEDRRG
jgi:two-component system nitrate/nitrite response regulator NarP